MTKEKAIIAARECARHFGVPAVYYQVKNGNWMHARKVWVDEHPDPTMKPETLEIVQPPHAIQAPQMCICIAWIDDRGAFNHIHYMDMLPSDVHKILNRKHEKEITARSTFMTITYTIEPCATQSKARGLDAKVS